MLHTFQANTASSDSVFSLHRVPAIICLCLALSAFTGCGKGKLDKNVDRLVEALRKNDYESFKNQSSEGVIQQFGQQKFNMLSHTIKSLGAFKDRTMKGINVKSGGFKEGNYKLEFEKGEVQLRITLKKDKLIGFEFSGNLVEKGMKQARAKMFSEFKVLGIRFVDTFGKPKSNVIKQGEKLIFQIGVGGLTPGADQTLVIRADLQVANSKNESVLEKPNFINAKLPIKKNDPPVATLNGTLTVPKPDSYLMGLRITDLISGKSVIHKEAFKVEP